MPEQLAQQLKQLRTQLTHTQTLSDDEQQELLALLQQIDARFMQQNMDDTEDNLVDGVNLLIERFEVDHPGLTHMLRNIVQSLASMGI